MTIVLNPVEARVLGALVEKEATTPEYYPLSLNALVNACNQKNNRDPEMHLDETEVRQALHRLEERGLLDAEWRDTLTGREAKFYKLTRPGRKQLDVEMSDWEKMSDAVALILRTAH